MSERDAAADLTAQPEHRLERWVVQLDAGLMGVEERAALDRWLAADEAHRERFAEVSALWFAAQVAAAPPRETTAAGPSGARRRARWLAAVAAALALAVGLARLEPWYRYGADVYVTAGRPVLRTALADGTTLWAAPDTVLEIDVTGAGARTLRLARGSVRVQVAPDPARPFSVRAAGVVVTVAGTDFGVARQDDRVTTALLEGRVTIDGALPAPVTPEAGTVWAVAAGTARALEQSAATALGWSRGLHTFVDRPLSAVLDELEPYLGVRILAAPDPKLRVTATLRAASLERDLAFLLAERGLDRTRLPGLWIVR